MSGISVDLNILGMGNREQKEQHTIHATTECSQSTSRSENIGNKIIGEIENPIDTLPIILSTPHIVRPCYLSHQDWFELNGRKMKPGVYWHGWGKTNDEPEIDEWICSTLSVEAITCTSSGEDFGRLLRFRDSNGQWHQWAMPMHMLKGTGDELRGELLNQGVIFNLKKRYDLPNYIMNEHPAKRITAANRVGWHDRLFILPNQVIGGANIVYQSESATESDFQLSGNIYDWQQGIGKLCIDNIPLMVAVSVALAGPLLRLVNRQQGGGIHFVGDSSSGKSTAVEVAASVWGPPEFIRSWSATANGLEGIAATRNDTCLILDEIDESSPLEIGKIAYMLVNGQGKQRAGRIGNARKIQRWCTMAISTGERTLKSIMSEAGKDANTGQLVRLLSIPIAFEYGAFSNLHNFSSGRELSDHLKFQRLKHYGHIGPSFVKKLIEDTRDFPEILEKITNRFCSQTNNSMESRAASVFSIIGMAGELAIEYKLLPWNEGSALEAVLEVFRRWKDFQGTGQTEDKRILLAISDFISRHGDSRFSLLGDDNKTVSNRAGWYKNTDEGRIYIFFPQALVEACGKFEKSRIVRTLAQAECIVERDDKSRYTKKTRIPGGGSKNLYYIREKELEI